MTTTGDGPRILVLGSLTWETVLVPLLKAPDPADPSPTASTQMPLHLDAYERHHGWVGAPTVRDMIQHAIVEVDSLVPDVGAAERAQLEAIDARLCQNRPDLGNPDRHTLLRECGEITAVFRRFPKKTSTEQKSEILRVAQSYYASGGSTTVTPPLEDKRALSSMQHQLQGCIERSGNPNIIVVYDRDRQFRKNLASLLPGIAFGPGPRALIVALVAETVDQPWASTLLDTFRNSGQCQAKDTVVLVTVDALRRLGLNIIEYGSIEHTVTETTGYLTQPPLQDIMSRCDHLVLVFEETGILYVRRGADRLFGSIHFCPNFDRVAQMDRESYGNLPGRTEIAIAAIVKQRDAEMRGLHGHHGSLDPALRLAVAGYNLHFSEGIKGEPFQAMAQAIGLERRRKLQEMLESNDKKKRDREFFVASLTFPPDDTVKAWNRVREVLPADAQPDLIKEVLQNIVRKGDDSRFRRSTGTAIPGNESWFPAAQISCPYLQVGKIKTVDPKEISGFVDLAKLMTKYLRDERWSTPLSIAVFGSPGTGKSTAVKELLKAVNPGAKGQPVLTYNLAQFDSVALLTEAFHQVQDRALASTDVPLVIFDEFDCTFGSIRLGWLKYFLAPMQDGVFRGATNDYRVGRAIFLFAGGTTDSFKDFRSKEDSARGKAAKLTDFISRLKGYLDVQSINPPDVPGKETEEQRVLRMVRRAMILRSLLLEHAKPIAHPGPEGEAEWLAVNDDVIDAFMNAEKYQHSVRSMEAVIRMSRPIDGHLLPASIPSNRQLAMHVKGFWPSQREGR